MWYERWRNHVETIVSKAERTVWSELSPLKFASSAWVFVQMGDIEIIDWKKNTIIIPISIKSLWDEDCKLITDTFYKQTF